MKNPFTSKDLPEPVRRRVEMSVAVAQERLLNTHIDHALYWIGLVGDEVEFEDTLRIYIRLLRLSDDEARILTTRALATLGERSEEGSGEPAPPEAAPEELGEPGGRRSFLENIRQRLRGRGDEETRRVVELAAARTEVALLETHVANALKFVDLLDDELSLQDAVELYLDALDVRDAVAEVVYYLTLSRLGEDILPGPVPRREREEAAEAPRPDEEEPMRVVERERG